MYILYTQQHDIIQCRYQDGSHRVLPCTELWPSSQGACHKSATINNQKANTTHDNTWLAITISSISSKTAHNCKESVHPSKAELTVIKSDDIIVRPCVRYASCKY